MTKAAALKKWFDLAEASEYVSKLLGDEIKIVDLVRYAIDGHLQLSARFVGHQPARVGHIVASSQLKPRSVPSLDGEGTVELLGGIPLGGTEAIVFEEGESFITGIFNLPMFGGERVSIENRYQELKGLNGLDVIAIDGAFVSDPQIPEQVYQILKVWEHVPTNSGNVKRTYVPSTELPENAELVILKSEIKRLVESVNAEAEMQKGESANLSELEHYPRLAALIRARRAFWERASRDQKDTWPKTSEILKYLREKGFDDTLAQRGATIIRPSWAGKGRLPKNSDA